MSVKPAISVIIPVFNRRALLPRAIDSVLAQTFTDFELIVVDDASHDGSGDVALGYSDPRVRVEINPQNRGAAGSRNRGLELARADIVAFQDSDDRWMPEKLAVQYAALTTSGADAAFCRALYYSQDQCYAIPDKDFPDSEKIELLEHVLVRNPTTPQTLMVKRELLQRVGGFDEALKINEDWDLALRLAQQVPFVFQPEPMVLIYRTPNSVSSNQLADGSFRVDLVKRYKEHYSKAPEAIARQYYIAASIYQKSGEKGRAIKLLTSCLLAQFSLKALIKLILAIISLANIAQRPR